MKSILRILLAGFLLIGCRSVRQNAPSRAAHFTGNIGEFEYVVSEGSGEPVFLGSYTVSIYRSREYGDFLNGIIRERSGWITEILVADLNGNEFPELIVCFQQGSGGYGSVEIFKTLDDGNIHWFFSDPADWHAEIHGYRGGDRFYVEDGILYRDFYLYHPDDPTSTPRGGRRIYRFDVDRLEWVISALQTNHHTVTRSRS